MLAETTFMPLEFLRPYWLLGLVMVFLSAFFGYRTTKKSTRQTLIAAHLSENLVTPSTQSAPQRLAFTLLAAIACIALAGPSWRSVDMPLYQAEKAQVLALDLSYSMYATDLQPNRLSQAKYKAIDLIKKWGEGEKALISYAGDAFTISPLTADGNSIINHIPQLSPDIMPVTGSRADLALEKAITLLKNAGYTQGHIVFISDGIDSESADKMLTRLKGSPWIVSILAVATEQGAPIKLADGSLLKNTQGEIVVPKLQQKELYDISRASGGLYLTLSKSNSDIEQLGEFFNEKGAHKNKDGQSGKNKFAKDDGYWLACLLLPLFLLLFRKGVFYALLLAVTIPLSVPKVEASIWKNDQQNALQAYQDKDYTTAAELYKDPLSKGSSFYKNQQYQQALQTFTQATIEQPNNADAFYNQGNTYAQLQKFDKAIQAYQQALTIKPEFNAAQENKKIIEQLKKQQQQKQQNKDQQKKQQDSKQQDSKQQDSKQQNSKQQNSKQQDSKQQNSKQQNSKQQDSKQQDSKQQNSKQQDSKQQKAEQQKAEQQKAEQQKAEQQKAEQQKAEQQKKSQDKAKEQQAAALSQTPPVNQELENLPMWLKNMPDDPSLLLRNKMRVEYQKRAQSQPVKQQSNGDIW